MDQNLSLSNLTPGASVHAVFSPNGRYVLFNDSDPSQLNKQIIGVRIGIIDLMYNV